MITIFSAISPTGGSGARIADDDRLVHIEMFMDDAADVDIVVSPAGCSTPVLSTTEVPISTNEGFAYKHLYFIALHDFQVASF